MISRRVWWLLPRANPLKGLRAERETATTVELGPSRKYHLDCRECVVLMNLFFGARLGGAFLLVKKGATFWQLNLNIIK